MNSKTKYVIAHLEPRLWKWCQIEYSHISKIAGKENVIFTNIKERDIKKLNGLGTVYTKSLEQLGLKNICVLDPLAKKTLSKDDSFDYLVFGGILGDEPMQGRTEKELSSRMSAQTRNLGKEQMPTDTAVYVAKHIVDGGSLSDLKFQDEIEIQIKEGESIVLPFRYVLRGRKPLLPDGLPEFLKKRRSF